MAISNAYGVCNLTTKYVLEIRHETKCETPIELILHFHQPANDLVPIDQLQRSVEVLSIRYLRYVTLSLVETLTRLFFFKL
jgi:hypothetical protein